MKDEIKEIYLSNLEWTKTHDNMGGVIGNVVFKNSISLKEFEKIVENTYVILCDKDYITNLQEENRQTKLLKEKYQLEKEVYKLRNEKAIEYNYELQERYCHSALYDDLVASKIYEISEKNIRLLNGGDEE